MLPDKKIKRGTRDYSVIRERTLDEIVSCLDWAIAQKADETAWHGTSTKKGGWSGTDTVEQYRDMLRDGWPEGIQEAEGLDGLSTDRAERLTFVRNVGGVFPVVPAYLAGAPDAMLDVRPQPVDNTRAVTLVVDSSFNCNVTSETALQYAQKVMRVVAWLSAEGIDCAVKMIVPVQLSRTRAIYIVPVRECGDVMQAERLAAIIHPAFLRRAWFALLEYEHEVLELPGARSARGGYGSSNNASADELKQAMPDAASIVMLPKVGSGDPEKAVQEALSIKLKQD